MVLIVFILASKWLGFKDLNFLFHLQAVSGEIYDLDL